MSPMRLAFITGSVFCLLITVCWLLSAASPGQHMTTRSPADRPTRRAMLINYAGNGVPVAQDSNSLSAAGRGALQWANIDASGRSAQGFALDHVANYTEAEAGPVIRTDDGRRARYTHVAITSGPFSGRAVWVRSEYVCLPNGRGDPLDDPEYQIERDMHEMNSNPDDTRPPISPSDQPH